jgi:hypothetical protein
MNRGQLPADCCRPIPGDGLERISGRNTICPNTPSHIMSPTTGSQPGSSTEVSLGARGHTITSLQRAHAPPDNPAELQTSESKRLTRARGTSKQYSRPAGRRSAHRQLRDQHRRMVCRRNAQVRRASSQSRKSASPDGVQVQRPDLGVADPAKPEAALEPGSAHHFMRGRFWTCQHDVACSCNGVPRADINHVERRRTSA